MIDNMTIKLGGHRGFGCTDHDFYQDKRDIASLPVENTLASIKAAFEAGADYVETDAVMSADGVIFALHNVVPKDHFFAADMPADLLNKMPFDAIGAYHAGRYQNGVLARMSDILDYIATIDPATLPWAVNIEIKGVQGSGQNYEENDYLKNLARLVEQSALPVERVLFSSFSLENIIRMSHLLPQAKYGMLFADQQDARGIYSNYRDNPRFQYLPFNADHADLVINIWQQEAQRDAKLEYAHPEIMTVTPDMVSYAAKRHLGLNVWALFEKPDQDRMAYYRNTALCADEKNVPFTAITDYIADMQKPAY